MPRLRTSVATSPFGIWLEKQLKRFDTPQKKVVNRSGVAQATIGSYLSGVRKPKNREMVEKVVRGLLPDDVDTETAEQVLHDGLVAAGLPAPTMDPAKSLVIDISSRYEGGDRLASSVIASLASEVRDFAQIRVERVIREALNF